MVIETRVIRFQGSVQGVGFRWRARHEAIALKLSGSVRNQSDGSVELRVTGEPATIENLVDNLVKVFRVSSVSSHRAPTERDARGFRIDIDA